MEAVIQVTRFRDGGLSTDFSLGFGDRSPASAQSTETAACFAEGGILPLLIIRTVLACGPFSPSSSTKLTVVPTFKRENARLRTLFLWK
jgi:hypothetical protein